MASYVLVSCGEKSSVGRRWHPSVSPPIVLILALSVGGIGVTGGVLVVSWWRRGG